MPSLAIDFSGKKVPQFFNMNAFGHKIVDDAPNGYDQSFRFRGLGANSSSYFEFVATVMLDTTITFWRKVSCEATYDYFAFYIDGVEKYRDSGAKDWIQVTINVTAGTHTFKFAYTKDASGGFDQDTAWVTGILLGEVSSPTSDDFYPNLAPIICDFDDNIIPIDWVGNWLTSSDCGYDNGIWVTDGTKKSLQSNDITSNETTDEIISFHLNHNGVFSFVYRGWYESADTFKVLINDIEFLSVAGNNAGFINGELNVVLKADVDYVVKFRYTKDSSMSVGGDCVYVDRITIPWQQAPTEIIPHILKVGNPLRSLRNFS